MDKEMIYAPMIIPTLCRYNHFRRLIESLKKNSWAKYTEIYVGLDYPAKDEHWKGYKQICEYLSGDFSEFKSFYVNKREENYGVSNNTRALIYEIEKKHDTYIYSDDDLEYSPNFLEYMDKALIEFRDRDDIIAVTGYSYPLNWKLAQKDNAFLCNFICPSWGTGFWVKKIKRIRKKLENGILRDSVYRYINNRNIKNLTDRRLMDYYFGVLDEHNTLLYCASDVALSIFLGVENKYIIMPRVSKCRNHGFDGTGIYCQNVSSEKNHNKSRGYLFHRQEIDTNKTFPEIKLHNITSKANKRKMNRFDPANPKIILEIKVKIQLCKLFGLELFGESIPNILKAKYPFLSKIKHLFNKIFT